MQSGSDSHRWILPDRGLQNVIYVCFPTVRNVTRDTFCFLCTLPLLNTSVLGLMDARFHFQIYDGLRSRVLASLQKANDWHAIYKTGAVGRNQLVASIWAEQAPSIPWLIISFLRSNTCWNPYFPRVPRLTWLLNTYQILLDPGTTRLLNWKKQTCDLAFLICRMYIAPFLLLESLQE